MAARGLTPQITPQSNLCMKEDFEARTHHSSLADSVMDMSSSPEIRDSRKRPSVGDDGTAATKKSLYSGGANGTHHLKLLVPNGACGAIIGKGGETIEQLKKDIEAGVTMSKANDFYPGTSERVCLIKGSVDAIMEVLTFIMEKIRDSPDLNATDFDNKRAGDRHKQVKILVPDHIAGKIIGYAASCINHIKKKSGACIKISHKDKDQIVQERCVTVTGDMESNKRACRMILDKIVQDPQSGTCLNISYADVTGPAANNSSTVSPHTDHNIPWTPMHVPFNNVFVPLVGGMLLSDGSLNLNLKLGAPSVGTSPATHQLDQTKGMLHASGFSGQTTNELTAAITGYPYYGLLGMGLGLPAGSGNSSSGSYLGVGPMGSTPFPQTSHNVFGPIGPMSGLGSSSLMPHAYNGSTPVSSYDSFCCQSGPGNVSIPISQNSNSFGMQTPQQQSTIPSVFKKTNPSEMKGEQQNIELEVCEDVIGAILGHGGQDLAEIRRISGAHIQTTKRGTFAPGTRNRIVSITGTPDAISTAQYLIGQRISEKEAKRAQKTRV